MTSSQVDHNLAVLAEAQFSQLGDYESLVFEGRTYRSGELFDRACRASSGLVKLGVSPGERVVVLMANCPEVGIAYTAIWRAGAVVTPVVFLVSPPELQHILADSGAVAVVTTPELRRPRLAARARSRCGLRRTGVRTGRRHRPRRRR
jgi:long-chain acyl-CoA synthetase